MPGARGTLSLRLRAGSIPVSVERANARAKETTASRSSWSLRGARRSRTKARMAAHAISTSAPFPAPGRTSVPTYAHAPAKAKDIRPRTRRGSGVSIARDQYEIARGVIAIENRQIPWGL